MQSRLIDGLEWDLDEDGSGGLCNVHGDKVHLRQGDMDGACGPYCLVMAMLVRGQLRRRQAKGLERVDSRSRYGRLMKALDQHGPLLRVGTTGVDLLELLADAAPAADGQLPDTGVGLATERLLSSVFIASPSYGTRASSVVRVHADGTREMIERSFGPSGARLGEVSLVLPPG